MRNSLAYYEARVAHGIAALLPALLAPAYGIFVLIARLRHGTTPSQIDIATTLSLLLPLSAGLSAGHLMTVEREEHFDELRRSYAEPTWRLPLMRLAGALSVVALSAALAAVLIRAAGGTYPLIGILLPAVPGTLLAMALAMAAGNVTGSAAAAIVAVIAYWFLELQTQGEVTGSFFLFNPALPRDDVDATLNVVLLLGTAVALCLANVAWSIRRRRVGG